MVWVFCGFRGCFGCVFLVFLVFWCLVGVLGAQIFEHIPISIESSCQKDTRVLVSTKFYDLVQQVHEKSLNKTCFGFRPCVNSVSIWMRG